MDTTNKIATRFHEHNDIDKIKRGFLSTEINDFSTFMTENGTHVIYPNDENHYVVHSEMTFAFKGARPINFPVLLDKETVIDHARTLIDLNHIVDSLKTDLKSGILKTRVHGDEFLVLEKELKMFGKSTAPLEYQNMHYIKEPDFVHSFEATEQLMKRFKKYLGIIILR